MSSFFVLYLAVLGSVAFIGFWNYAKLSGPFRVITWLIAYTLISESLTRFSFTKPYTYYLYSAYSLAASVGYLIAIALMTKSKIRRLIIFSFLVLVIAISFYFLSSPTDLTNFPSNYILASTPFKVIAILIYFFDLLQRNEFVDLKKSPSFLFTSTLLVYSCISFTHLSLFDYFIDGSLSPWLSIWIHSIATFLYYSFLGYIFVLDSKRIKA